MKKKRVGPTYEQIAPGEFRVRTPAGYFGLQDAEDLVRFVVLDALSSDIDPQPTKQGPGQKAGPALSPAERHAAHERFLTAALMRVATSQRHLDALLQNEGIPLGPCWIDEGQAVREQTRRRASERTATYTIFTS